MAVRNRVEGIEMKGFLLWIQILVFDFLRGALAIRPSELFFVLATLISLAGFNLWQYFSEEVAFYGKCTAVSILLWIYAYYRLTSKRRWEMKCIAEVVSWWALVNCADELFFDPYTKSWPEFICAGLTALFVYVKYKKYLWVQRLRQWVRKL